MDAKAPQQLAFGFRKRFDGFGVFVFKDGYEYKLIAMEDMGHERIDIATMKSKF